MKDKEERNQLKKRKNFEMATEFKNLMFFL